MDTTEAYETPLPAIVDHERGEPIARPTAAQLSDVIELIGPGHDSWITCSPLPERDGHFIQALRHTSGGYEVESRAGLDTEITSVTMPAGDEVTVAFLRQIRDWAPAAEHGSIPTTAVPEIPIDPDARTFAERVATTAVAGGFQSFPDIVRSVVESAEPDRPITAVQARRLVQPVWDAQVAVQATWTGMSDNQRLDNAFAALDGAAITARQDFACCRNCGMAEIEAERDGARGFVFYHQQDTEAAADGHGLYLAYGGFDGSQETTAAVGREVVAVLVEAGLQPDWDGSPGQRIFVPMQWRRSLPV